MTEFSSQIFARVEEQRKDVVERLLWVLGAIVVVTLALVINNTRQGLLGEPAFWVNVLVIPAILVALLYNRRRRLEVAVGIVLALVLLAGTVPIVLGGLSANELSGLIFAVAIVLAGLVLERRALIFTTAWGVGAILFVTVLDAFGAIPSRPGVARPSIGLAAQSGVLLLLIGYFLDRFGGVFQATLTDALDYQVRLKEHANERLRAQAALLSEQRLTDAVVENLPGIFSLIRQDGSITRWNKNLLRVLGYSEDEIADASVFDVVPREDRDKMADFMRRILEGGGGTAEARIVAKDGTVVPYLLTGSRFKLGNEDYIVGVGLDRGEIAAAKSRIETLNLELQERLERISALHEIDRAITGSLDLDLTLDVVLQQVTERLRVDAASVLLLQKASHTLVFGAARGFGAKVLQGTSLRLGEGLAGRAAFERTRVVVDDPAELEAAFPEQSSVRAEGFACYVATPLISKGQLQGVLEIFHHSQLELSDDWHDFLTTLATQAAIALDNAALFENLERSNLELRLAYDRTIEGWARALDLRDEETEGHSRRVTDMAVRLATSLGVPDADLVHLRRGALLHDIGKMGIPDNILLKPGKLEPEEWEIMKRHPTYAVDLITPIEFLVPALPIPYAHHEKWDGSGYPRGLSGHEIPFAARIFAVVDVFDALTSDRPYRKAWPKSQALAHIAQESGKHFDPQVVDAFLEMVD